MYINNLKLIQRLLLLSGIFIFGLIALLPVDWLFSPKQVSANSSQEDSARPNRQGREGWPATASEQNLSSFTLHPNFPVKVSGNIKWGGPLAIDLNQDGSSEIFVGTGSGDIYRINANGRVAAGYPLETGGSIQSPLAAGDINGDGQLELVVAISAADSNPGGEGMVNIINAAGQSLPGWPQNTDRFDNIKPGRISTVALADLDNDADLEVLAGTNNNIVGTGAPAGTIVPDLYAWHHTGSLVSGWPAEDGPGIGGTLAIGDLDSDGILDVAVGRDYSKIFTFDSQGNELTGWPANIFVNQNDGTCSPSKCDRIVHWRTGPSMADLDRDGQMDFIFASQRRVVGSGDSSNVDLLVLKPDSSRRREWATPATGTGILWSGNGNTYEMFQGVAIADINSDDKLDIISTTQDGWIRAYNANKSLIWQFNYAQNNVIQASEAVVGDVDGDSLLEVVFGTYDPDNGNTGPIGIWILEHDGTPKGGHPLSVESPGIVAPPQLTDFDQDGKLEIVAANRKGWIYVWDTPATTNLNLLPWPMGRHDAHRTGRYGNEALLSLTKSANRVSAEEGETLTYTIQLQRSFDPISGTIQIEDIIPNHLSFKSGSLVASSGTPDESQAPILKWVGNLSDTAMVELTYVVTVPTNQTVAVSNTAEADIDDSPGVSSTFTVILNPEKVHLPVIFKSP